MTAKKSPLQTAKQHTLANPSERHEANKAVLQTFYAQIHHAIEAESKLTCLHRPEFKTSYLQPRYWFACRSKSNQADSENEIIRIKVSNRQFCQISNDNKEVAIDLRSTWAVVSQTKNDYSYFVDTLQICQYLQSEFEAQKNDFSRQEIQRLRLRSEQYFGLFEHWHFETASIRICVLVRDKLDRDRVIYVYNKEQAACVGVEEATINSTFLQSTLEDHLFMMEIVKVHHCKQLHEKDFAQFKQSFLRAVKGSVSQKIQAVLQQERRKISSVLQNQSLAKAFMKYEGGQSEELLVRWKNQSAKLVKNKKLFIQVLSILLSKAKVLKTVVLTLKSQAKDGKEESKSKQYFYKSSDAEYSTYELQSKEESQCLAFEIQKSVFSKQILIEVEATYLNGGAAKFRNTFLHFKLEGQDAFTHQLSLYSGDSKDKENDCFIFLKAKESRLQSLNSIVEYHRRAVFDQVGHIPTKYGSFLAIDYNPSTYSIVRQLLLPQAPQKISKVSYQQGYLCLVEFIQQQENKSQLLLANLPEAQLVNKCPMRLRLHFYEKQLLKNLAKFDKRGLGLSDSAMSQQQRALVNYLQSIDPQMLDVLCGKEFWISQQQYKNLLQDLAHYKPLNQQLVRQSLVKLIYFVSKVPVLREFPYPLRYVSNLVPILERYLAIIFNSKSSNEEQAPSNQKYTLRLFLFILAIAKIYPYCDANHLKKDLLIVRNLVHAHLPFYNDSLNRLHLGLENVIASHFLNLFTDLSEQLTFRIWDFLISSQSGPKARIVVAFTLLTYFQTTKNLPIIPINLFMAKVEENYGKLAVPVQPGAKELKGVQSFFASEEKKAKRLQRLIRENQRSVADDKYIQRIVLGQTLIKEPEQQRIRAQYEPNKVVQCIRELAYPLPRPNYFGKAILEVVVFVHSLNILQNLNLVAQKYVLRLSCPLSKQQAEVFVASKNHFYNQSFKLPLEQGGQEGQDSRVLLLQLLQKGARDTVELEGRLALAPYHKDKAYKALVTLAPRTRHNKGATVLSLSFCLKSSDFNAKAEPKSFSPLEQLGRTVLGYELGQLSEPVRRLSELQEQLEQVKSPLDQFQAGQNKRIRHAAIGCSEADWLDNSRTSIEGLKTIFYHIFPHDKDKDLKLEFSKIYEIFAEEHHMQSLQLSEVLARLILCADITRKKKLTYLYCLGVHYQNCCTKRLTSETLNSMLRLLLTQRELLTACPYELQTCGHIIEAYFLSSSLKNQDEKTLFTQLLQDWLYICTLKFGYCGLVLGSANNLSILRSLFDQSTLKKIESRPECRFEVVYELASSKYLWVVVVDSKSFEIVKRGTKFLNSFDGYSELKYLDSTQEYLYNCQNTIPLQVQRGYSYSEFTKIMLQNELVKYALEVPAVRSSQEKQERVILKDALQDSRSSSINDPSPDDPLSQKVVHQQEQEDYASWVLHRTHNCLENWRSCSILSPGPILSEIRYRDDPEVYTVNTIDLISMDEITTQDSRLQPQRL